MQSEFRLWFFILWASLLSLAGAKPSRPRGEGLYLYTDKIEALNFDTLEKHLLLSRTAWIVEFYSSWCGHCQNYAPTWKEFASEIYGWRNVVRVGAVDCADEKNTPTCRTYQVMRYPTVRLFPPGMTTDKFLGVDIPNPTLLKNADMRRKVADYVEEVRVKYSAVHFPDLAQLKDTAELPKPRDGTKVRAVVFEWDGEVDDVGRSVLLDASLFEGVEAYRAGAVHPLYAKHGVLKTPAVLFLDPDGKELGRLAGDELSSAKFAAALSGLAPDLKELAPGYNEEDDAGLHRGLALDKLDDAEADNEVAEAKPAYDRHIFAEDVTSAVRYSLLHEVALHAEISGDTLRALAAFVRALGAYFPVGGSGGSDSYGGRTLKSDLEKLSAVIHERVAESQGGQPTMTSDEWLELVQPIFAKVPEVKFVSCQGSAPKFRGYPCSLWTLFHALTVEAASRGNESRYRDVIDGIHGFVKHFFSCRYCSKHFDEMYRDTSADIKGLRSSVMWLWIAHNKVNRRLAGDISEDPRHPKTQFPPAELCPDCFDETTSRWRDDRVYAFLTAHYGAGNVRTESDRVLVTLDDDRTAGGKDDAGADVERERGGEKVLASERAAASRGSTAPAAAPGLFLTLADVTICSAMYVLSAAMLVFVYFYFVASRRHRRSLHDPLLPKWGKFSN